MNGWAGAWAAWVRETMRAYAPRPSEPPYMFVTAKYTACPTCQQPTTVLLRPDGEGPAFFLCWTCRAVGQAGVGPVLPQENPAEKLLELVWRK